MAGIIALSTLLLPGCGLDDGPRIATVSDPFCESVLPRVEAWLDSTESSVSVQGDAQFGGTVVVGGIGELATGMNVAATADYISRQHQQFVNLMTLVDYGPDLEPRPYLAESWEVSPDGRTLTFRLRRDVRWHDGEPTDADDVAFTYRLLTNPETGFPNAAFWDRYDTSEDGVEVLDDYTVRLHLEPHLGFMDPWRTVAILPEHLLGEVPPSELAGHPFGTRCPVGNGPFVFLEHRDQEVWRFAANPGFSPSLGGRPRLDAYVYRIIPDENTLLLELLSGGVDVFISPRPGQAGAMKEAAEVELRSYPFSNFTFAAWNARRPTLADARVRQALTLATDREEIVETILEGFGQVAHGTVPPWHWAHDPEVGILPFDPDSARTLLDRAGWRDRDGDGVREDASGRPLSVSLKYNQGNRRLQRVAEAMRAQVAEVGVALDAEVVEWSTLVQQITSPENREYDGVLLSWVTEFKLDDTDLFLSERIDQPYAFSGTRDAELDRHLEALGRVTDRDEARSLWREYQARLSQVQPYTFFYYPDRLDGVNRRLRNAVMDVRGEWLNVREWWIDPAER